MTEPSEPVAALEVTPEQLAEMMTRPYDPNDWKDPVTMSWVDFDPDTEGQVILNDLQNGRNTIIGLWRMWSYALPLLGGGGEALTFTAPLKKTGTTVTLTSGIGLQVLSDALTVKTAEPLSVGSGGVALDLDAIAGDGTLVDDGKITVPPSTDANNLITQGTDKLLLYKTA